jgi:hypothetical protein
VQHSGNGRGKGSRKSGFRFSECMKNRSHPGFLWSQCVKRPARELIEKAKDKLPGQ